MLLIINSITEMAPPEELYAQNQALKAEVANLQAQVAWFQRQMFGSRSEKLPAASPAQATLGLPDTSHIEPAKQASTLRAARARGGEAADRGRGVCERAGGRNHPTCPRRGEGRAGRV